MNITIPITKTVPECPTCAKRARVLGFEVGKIPSMTFSGQNAKDARDEYASARNAERAIPADASATTRVYKSVESERSAAHYATQARSCASEYAVLAAQRVAAYKSGVDYLFPVPPSSVGSRYGCVRVEPGAYEFLPSLYKLDGANLRAISVAFELAADTADEASAAFLEASAARARAAETQATYGSIAKAEEQAKQLAQQKKWLEEKETKQAAIAAKAALDAKAASDARAAMETV